MSDWRTKLGDAMVPVFERTRELPAQPWRLPLVRALAVVSNGLGARAPDPESMMGAMVAAMREALALEEAGHVGGELVEHLGAAWNVLLDHPRASRVEAIVRAPPQVEPKLVASRVSPKLLVVTVAEPEEAPAVDAPPPPELVAVKDAGDDRDEEAPLALPRRAIVPKEDPERFDPDAPPPPIVRLADEGGEPRPLAKLYEGTAWRALETASMLARHRTERRMTEWADEEARILECADAVAATGADCVARTRAWWRASLESPDPWKTWAPCFTLGVIDGSLSLRAIQGGLRALPPHASRHAALAAEALADAPHPDLRALVEDLCVDPHPVARAVGIDLASRSGMLSPERIAFHLADANPPVVSAAIRAAVRCTPPAPALANDVLRWMHHADRALAAEAARALTLLGRGEALFEVRRQGPLLAKLGALATIDLLVMAGEAGDFGLVRAILGKSKPSAAHLTAIARLGHAGTWAFLVHHLGEEDFARPALEALHTLFGPRVPHADRFNTSAWRDAIGAARFDPALRLRRGEPWTPAVVAAECTSTTALLSREQVERRLDELATRTAIRPEVDLARWSPISSPALQAYLGQMNKASRDWQPGSWACRSF